MSGQYEVAVPGPMRTAFSYAVPDSLDELAVPGARVVVPLGNRAVVGVIVERSPRRSETLALKNIKEVLDPLPALPAPLVELGRWLANYYFAPVGETFRMMLPPPVEVRVARQWRITDAGRSRRTVLQSPGQRSEAQAAELAVLELCGEEGKPASAQRIRKIRGGEAAAARLQRRGELAAAEVAQRRARRLQKVVAWKRDEGFAPPDGAAASGAAPAASARRGEVEARVRSALVERGPLPLAELLKIAGVPRSAVERLERSGDVQVWEEAAEAETSVFDAGFTAPSNVLNDEQHLAVEEIGKWLRAGSFVAGLMYGVTGSGKTEVYLRAVEEALASGRTALILVPEIALTLWMGRLCRAWFGDTVAVLHSALGEPERAREWWRVRHGAVRVVVGTRSAVFAPLDNLGLIIVDEEQDSSYKQEEAPRYNGRDVAVMRAKLESATVLLGSATPSLESFHHARQGKYKLLCLASRVENRPMAQVKIVDLREDFRATHRASPVSEPLRAALAERLASGTQALVLVNRRGYSWFALCRSCGASILCENCSISLTYHKRTARLVCHYCGFSRAVPKRCPKCDSEYLYYVGAGSEQLEERLRALFPQGRVARLDRDTARTKRAFEQVLAAFAAGRIDVLVGTQMVAKGHDFQRVTLVGVVSADAQLGFPDFRAAERTFQLLTQVAGRAGRGALAGEVLVETHYPEHYAIELAARQDYVSFFEKELHFRRLMHYPPFASLATLLVRSSNLERAIRWSRQLEKYFERAESRGVRVLGPAAAPLARLKREYRFQFLLKSPKRSALHGMLEGCADFCVEQGIPDRAVLVDVDPVNLL
jgi:primosomal protein N' (replication factor Y) (superfamily II helicase)